MAGSWYFILVRPVARRASIEYQRRIGCCRPARRWHTGAPPHGTYVTLPMRCSTRRWVDRRPALDGIRAKSIRALIRRWMKIAGGVLVVAHFGNLEVRAGWAARKDLRLSILVHTAHAERFNRVLNRINPQSAERLLQVTDVDTATIAHLATRVELGDFVVIAADRVPVTSERVLDAPFLGADAAFPIGPWVLAAALDCPVYWLACYQRPRDDGRYTLVCETDARPDRAARKTREAA